MFVYVSVILCKIWFIGYCITVYIIYCHNMIKINKASLKIKRY